MDEFGGILGNHPHDAYFEQVFKIREVALQLIREFLPQNQLKVLNLDTLEISSDTGQIIKLPPFSTLKLLL
jgi:hypothetical protein